jgi:hypothetical protein
MERLARSHETATALVRLREDLPDHELEAGHDVSTGQDVGFGEGSDIARRLVYGGRTLARVDHDDHLRTGIEPVEDLLLDV